MALTRLSVLALLFFASGNPADPWIQKVEYHYNGAQTLEVAFVENYSVLGHPRPPESGRLTLKKQGKMRWDYSQPVGKLFISDGKSVFLYTSGDNRVEKVPLKDTEDMRAPLAFLLGHVDLKREFQGFELRNGGDGTVWLKAGAKKARVPYGGIEMMLGAEGDIRKLNVFGRDQSTLSFSFAKERVNVPVADALFHFVPPAGAEVVDAAGFGSEEK